MFGVIERARGSEEWICLHSLGLARHPAKRRAEIDFLLITPQGCFVLEVKGGRIARREGRWEFTDRYGAVHTKAESPFAQAASAMFALEEVLVRQFGGGRLARPLLGYAVVFPDVHFQQVGAEGDERLVYDRSFRDQPDGFSLFYHRLLEATRESQTTQRWGLRHEDREVLVDFLRGDFELIPALSARTQSTNEELLQLTSRQYAVLEHLRARARVRVEGGAGTGKTLLAVECARRESRLGQRVLLLCYNRNLATFLRARVTDAAADCGITVSTLHSFFKKLIAASSLAEDFAHLGQDSSSGLYAESFPLYAQLAWDEQRPEPFDVLVMDEAQDVLSANFLEAISLCLKGGLGDGRWRLFLDSNNQAKVYGSLSREALAEIEAHSVGYVLDTNCRNTRQIASETRVLIRPSLSTIGGVDGVPVDRRWYAREPELLSAAREILARLRKNGAPAGTITVLSPRKLEGGLRNELERLGLSAFESDDAEMLAKGTLTETKFATVSSFKGLENDFIVLLAVEDIDDEWWQSVVYVGMSRARVGLYIVLHERLRESVRNKEARALAEVFDES